MPVYYQKEDGNAIKPFDYNVLCMRFACESYGCPVFGLFNEKVLEFPKAKDVDSMRMKVLESCGFVGVDAPHESERKELTDFLAQSSR